MKKFIFTAIALMVSTGAFAQIQSTYFLDNYTYSYRHNPANMTDRNFVGAVFANIEAGAGGNVGLSNFLYPAQSGNGLVTGLNSSVSSEEFLSGIRDRNSVLGNAGLNILSMGFRSENAMTTVELNVKASADVSIAGDLFRFLKEGEQNRAYDLSPTELGVKSYVEVAIGRSRRINETLSFGYRVKGLMGVAGAYARLEGSQATLSDSQIAVRLKGNAGIAGSLLQFSTDAGGKIDGVDGGSGFSPAGFGAAVDAGVNWEPLEGLTLSASVADLGLVSWKYGSLAEGDNTVNYNGVDLSGTNAKLGDELDKVMDDVKDLADFRQKSGSESSAEMLPFRVNAGARYRIPQVESLSAGVLVTYQNSAVPVVDARAAVTYTPREWFSLTANAGGSSFGFVWGGALSLNAPFLNFFFGLDAFACPMNSDYIPLNKFLCRLNLGLVFRFGEMFE